MEQMLTIFFATGVGVAIVLYFARSKNGAAPGLGAQSAVAQAYIPSGAVQATVADTSVVDVSSVSQPQVATEIPSATSEVAAPTEAAAVAAPTEAAAVAAPTEAAAVAAPAEPLSPIVEPTVTMEMQASAAASTTAVEVPAHTAAQPRRGHAGGRKRSSATTSNRTRRSSQRSKES